jgi:hypothetical protein
MKTEAAPALVRRDTIRMKLPALTQLRRESRARDTIPCPPPPEALEADGEDRLPQ